MQRGGPQYRTITYTCVYCKQENAFRVEISKPRFGGRNPQSMAPNKSPEPARYTVACTRCGQVNQV